MTVDGSFVNGDGGAVADASVGAGEEWALVEIREIIVILIRRSKYKKHVNGVIFNCTSSSSHPLAFKWRKLMKSLLCKY